MKLNRIHMKSFRSAVGLTLDTDARRVLIAGENGVGKTSVREAIRWNLTGRCEVTDGKGLGAEKLIPTGADDAAVTLEVGGVGSVSRSFAPSGNVFAVSGFTGNGSTQQEALYAKLGTTAAYLDAVLDTGHFLNLHHAEAKALLLAVLDVRVPVDGVPVTLDALDDLYQKAFEARKIAKVKLRGFSVPTQPVSPVPDAGNVPTVADVEKKLTDLRLKLEEKVSVVGQTSGQRTALQQQINSAKAFTPYVGSISAEDIASQILQLEAKLDGLQDEAASAADSVKTASGEVVNVTLLRSTIEALEAHKPSNGCVMDSQVTCETYKGRFKARAVSLQKTLGDAESDQVTATAPTGPSSAERALEAARTRLKALQQIRDEYASSAERQADREETVRQLTETLATLPDISQEEAALFELRTRVKKGEGILSAVKTYWADTFRYQDAAKTREKLAGDVETLEARCELTGPNGVRVAALGSALGAFEAAINTFTQPFGWTLKFQAEPWAVFANDRLVETYSESQQFLIGIALQLALAQSSGISFAVIDRMDMLLDDARIKATNLILKADMEQIIILASRRRKDPMPDAHPGVVAHRLELIEGRTRLVAEGL